MMRVKNNEIRIKIKEIYIEVLEQLNSKLLVPELSDEVLLLESGLDSLGFAILIATLEEKLEFDPFTIMEEPIYPTTFGEFIKIYEQFNPHN
jgi:acyl carrier protein